jgi:hypothetical protein
VDDLERGAWDDLVARAVDAHGDDDKIPVPADLLIAVESDLPRHEKDGFLAGVLAGFGVGLLLAVLLVVVTSPVWHTREDKPSPRDPAPSTRGQSPGPASPIVARPSGRPSTTRPPGSG